MNVGNQGNPAWNPWTPKPAKAEAVPADSWWLGCQTREQFKAAAAKRNAAGVHDPTWHSSMKTE